MHTLGASHCFSEVLVPVVVDYHVDLPVLQYWLLHILFSTVYVFKMGMEIR